MSTSFKSNTTDIEFLSKTRSIYQNELSFAGKGLKLNKREDGKYLFAQSRDFLSLDCCSIFVTLMLFVKIRFIPNIYIEISMCFVCAADVP